MAHKRAFLLPVVIDGTPERGASVPEKFHELQWTRLPGGDTPPAFVDRIKRLLSPDAPPAAADAATIGPIPVPSVGGSPLSKALGLGAGAIAAIALAYFIADKFWLSKHAAPSSTQTATVADDHASPDIPERSIAVLPFADMSEKKDQEYFSDGLTEELTDLLARTPELHVAARTSAFYFKGKPSTIAEIAKTLGVGNVLEGSVRKSGDTLRITVQLVQASNGYHLWSETYDRKVGDVFKTQDEIAGSVANALKVELLAGPLPGRTDNFEAYNLVLQGRFFGWQGEDQKALDCYERAVELDPNYALAWAYLSYEQSNPDWHSVDPRARQSAQRAITLDPNLPDGHIALGQFDFYHASQWKDAEKELQRALTLDPKNGWAWILKGELAFERGRTDEAIESAQKAVRLEPFSSGAITDLGKVLRETNWG